MGKEWSSLRPTNNGGKGKNNSITYQSKQTALVSSITGTSTPGEFLSIDVADEVSKLTVWFIPRNRRKGNCAFSCRHV